MKKRDPISLELVDRDFSLINPKGCLSYKIEENLFVVKSKI